MRQRAVGLVMLDKNENEVDRLKRENRELLQRVKSMDGVIKVLNSTITSQRETHINFKQIADTIEEVFWMTNPIKSEMIFISNAFERIWGHSCEDLLKNPTLFVDAIHEDDREFVISQLPKQVLGKYDVEYRIVKPNGDIRWIRDKAFPVFNEAGEVYRVTGVATDITKIKAAQTKMLSLEKLASLGTLSAGIAHEIKNPLNLIINSAKIIADELESNLISAEYDIDSKNNNELSEVLRVVQNMSKIVVANGLRADKIVKSMLLQSRTGTAELTSSNIKNIVEDGVKLSCLSMKSDYPFDLVFENKIDDVGEADIYPQDLSRVIQNLINNSLYSMYEKFKKKNAFKAKLKVELRGGSHSFTIIIKDNGYGIPKKIKDKVLEPFFTTKPAGKGTGLGLSMVNEIISQQHRGALSIDSVEGQFTRIELVIPRNVKGLDE